MKPPCSITKNKRSIINFGNRGMGLENDINTSNTYYLANNIAVIYKKPTPITITKVHYPSRLEAVITEAYFKTPSTTDYNGLYKGRYIDFEAKETKNTSFPLANIHIHQINHLKQIIKHGGIAFLIVRFSKVQETYLLEAKKLFLFLESANRKSIPYTYFVQNGYLIKEHLRPRVHYLEIIDKLYFGGSK